MALSKRLRRNRGWIALLAVAVIAGAVYYMTTRATRTKAAETTYTTEAASTGTLQVTVSGSGNLELADEREVYPKTSGTIDAVNVETGDKVSKGDVLYTLDASDAEAATTKALAAYRQAQSSVAQATAQLGKAESSYEALKDKADAPNSQVTDTDIAVAEADVTSAKAQLASAKASRSEALGSYNDALDAEDDLEVKAPVAGTVWAVNVVDGDAVSAGSGSSSSGTASSSGSSGASGSSAGTGSTSSAASGSSAPVTIAANKPLVATLSVNEVDLPSLKKGQRADLAFDALPDLAMTGKVTAIANEGTVSSGVVTFDVTVKLDVENKQLKPGMTVSATIVTNVERDALLVSNAAVKTSSSDDSSYVLMLDADGKSTKQVPVTVGLSNDTQTQILSGLSAGDKVVTATSDSSTSSQSSGSNRGGGFGIMGGGMPGGGPGGRD